MASTLGDIDSPGKPSHQPLDVFHTWRPGFTWKTFPSATRWLPHLETWIHQENLPISQSTTKTPSSTPGDLELSGK